MIERIKEFFEDIMIRKVLKKSSADIFTKKLEFEYLESKYCKDKKSVDRLLIYCILQVASQRTPRTKEQKFDSVKLLFYENLKLLLENNSMSSIIEIQKLEAHHQFLGTKLERMNAEELLEIDKYSFTSMQYEMEFVNKGAIRPETYEFITKQSKKIAESNKKIMNYKAKQNQN